MIYFFNRKGYPYKNSRVQNSFEEHVFTRTIKYLLCFTSISHSEFNRLQDTLQISHLVPAQRAVIK